MRSHHFGYFLLAIVAWSTPVGDRSQANDGEPLKMRVIALCDEVTACSGGSEEWMPAKVGMRLGKGDEVMTGVGAWVELALNNDTVTRFGSTSRVVIDDYLEDAEAVRTRLHLKTGAVGAVVGKGKLKSDFRVSTTDATAAVRGTEVVEVRKRLNDTSVIMGSHGLMALIAGGRETPIGPGQRSAGTITGLIDALRNKANDYAAYTLPLGSTPQERNRFFASRRFGDVSPSDAKQGVAGVPLKRRSTTPKRRYERRDRYPRQTRKTCTYVCHVKSGSTSNRSY